MELIDKEKVIKEVKKVYDEGYKFLPSDINESVEDFKYDLLGVLDTLEVKEVDLNEEVKKYINDNFTSAEKPDEFLTTVMQLDDMVLFAKHFFELGLNARKRE